MLNNYLLYPLTLPWPRVKRILITLSATSPYTHAVVWSALTELRESQSAQANAFEAPGKESTCEGAKVKRNIPNQQMWLGSPGPLGLNWLIGLLINLWWHNDNYKLLYVSQIACDEVRGSHLCACPKDQCIRWALLAFFPLKANMCHQYSSICVCKLIDWTFTLH